MWRRWLLILVVTATAITLIAFAEVFSLAHQAHGQRIAHTSNQYQPIYGLTVQVLLTGWDWLDARINHDTISTLAIVVTACFTGTLWWSTKRLWESSETHALHMERSVQAAKTSADAAMLQAKIAEKAFSDIERPWLFLEGAHISLRESQGWKTRGDGSRIENPRLPNDWFITLKFRNVGRMPALVHDCIFKIEEKNGLPKIPVYENAGGLTLPGTIAPNESADSSSVGPGPGRSEQLIFFGKVTYKELNGKLHHTGFAIEVAPYMPAFMRYANDAYDYYD